MTTTAVPIGSLSGLISPTRSTAQSPSGTAVYEMEESIRQHLLESYAIGSGPERAFKEIEAAEEEASEDGWNGYGAKKLDTEASFFARVFLASLPTTAPIPEISADPDGEVALDWFFGDRRALSVSIGARGRCTYAWVRGQSSSRGTDWIDNEIPASIVQALAQLAS